MIGTVCCGIEFDANDIPEYVKNIRYPLSDEAEAFFECDIDAKLLTKTIGIDLSRGSDFTEYTAICYPPTRVQVRRHKKKRINKKWAKRYGYKMIFKSFKLKEAYVEPYEKGLDILGRDLNHD